MAAGYGRLNVASTGPDVEPQSSLWVIAGAMETLPYTASMKARGSLAL
jgi:hypothetical protein